MIRIINETNERNYIVWFLDDSGNYKYFLVSSSNRMYTYEFANDISKQFETKGYANVLPKGFRNWIGMNPNKTYTSNKKNSYYNGLRKNSTPVYVDRDSSKLRDNEEIDDKDIIDLR